MLVTVLSPIGEYLGLIRTQWQVIFLHDCLWIVSKIGTALTQRFVDILNAKFTFDRS
jgi:hypothetical protein